MIVEKIRGYNDCGFKAICKCDWCGKEFEKKYGDIKELKHQFCSAKCWGKWLSKNNVDKNHPMFGKHLPEEWKKHLSKNHADMNGKNHPMWKGGRTQKSSGYILIYKPEHPFTNRRNQVREHRLVMEKFLGRYLIKEEIVHHINGIVDDNRIENLMLFANNGEHIKYHKEQRIVI